MRDLLNAVVLGIIEGLTEFLPVSSTGHMILAMPLLGISADKPPWNILLWVSQLGAIAAVIVYFAGDLWRRIVRAPDPRGRTIGNHLLTKLFVAMVPTVALGLSVKKYLDPLETSPVAVALALILGAAAMWWIDRRFRPIDPSAESTTHRRRFASEIEDVSLLQAAWIGAIQCISMWPGVSRSGASIMGGMAMGLAPRVATEFSFYLAIPTMLGAGVRTLWKHRADLTPDVAGVVLVGTGTSFLVALVVIAGFMRFVRTQRFTPFVIYRVVLGAGVLAWAYWG